MTLAGSFGLPPDIVAGGWHRSVPVVQVLSAHLLGMDTTEAASGAPWGLEPLLDVNELAAYLRTQAGRPT